MATTGWGRGRWGLGPWGGAEGRINAPGWASSEFGDARVRHFRVITVAGIAPTADPRIHFLDFAIRRWQVAGWDSALYGAARFKRGIAPAGVDSAGYGRPTVLGGVDILIPAGFDSSAYGVARFTRQLRIAGFDSLTFGNQTWLSHYTRDIRGAGSISSLAVVSAGAKIINLRRYLTNAGGVAPGSFGAHQAIPTLWYFRTSSIQSGARLGTPRLSVTQWLYPLYLDSLQMPAPQVLRARRVWPQAWGSSFVGYAALGDQFSIGPAGWASSRVGRPDPWLRTQAAAPQGLAPPDVPQPESVENRIQVVVQAPHPDEVPGSSFGRPNYTFVLNRNRAVDVAGWRSDRISVGGFVTAGAWGILPDSMVRGQLWGVAQVAERVRYFRIPGIYSFVSTQWHNLRNAAVRYTFEGWPTGTVVSEGVGVRNVNRELRFETDTDPIAVPRAALVAPRVRRVTQTFPYASPDMPWPRAWHYTRRIEPPGLDSFETSHTFVEERFNRFFPSSIIPHARQVPREGYVYNRNPTIAARGGDMAEYGIGKLDLWTKYLRPQGDVHTVFGVHAIGDRTITVWQRLPAKEPTTPSPYAVVAYTSLTPDVTRTIWPKPLPDSPSAGDSDSFWGRPKLHTNRILLEGWQSAVIGRLELPRNYIFPVGFLTIQGGVGGLGEPKFNGTQWIILDATKSGTSDGTTGGVTGGDKKNGDGIEPTAFAKVKFPADFAPRTIWCAPTTQQALECVEPPAREWKVVDAFKWDKFPSQGPGWATTNHWVSNLHRTFSGYSAGHTTGYGSPRLQLLRRVVRPDGIRPGYAGTLHSFGGGLLRADLDDFNDGISPPVTQWSSSSPPEPISYNVPITHKVAYWPPPPPPPLVARGVTLGNTQVIGRPDVSHFHRRVYPSVFTSTYRPWVFKHGDVPYLGYEQADTQPPTIRLAYIGPRVPFPIDEGIPPGDFGVTDIDFRIRHLRPEGIPAGDMVYVYTRFEDLMRIWNRHEYPEPAPYPAQRVSVPSLQHCAPPVPDVYNRLRFVRPDSWCHLGGGEFHHVAHA